MDQTWLQQRPHLAPLMRSLDAVLQLADDQYKQGRANGDAVDYAFEERVAHATARVEQDVHWVALSGLDVDVPFIRVWRKHYRRVQRIARTYGSLSGPIAIERTLYRELGQRQGPVLDPIAMRAAGVVDGSWLPRTARAIAHLVSQVTSREAEVTGRELMRLPYSRSSIERVGHAVGAEYLSRREHVEPKLSETCELPPGITSVSVSVDRVTVRMEEPAAKEPVPSGRPVRLHEETLRKYGHEVSARTQAVLDEAEQAAKGGRPKPAEVLHGVLRHGACTTATATRCTQFATAACPQRSTAPEQLTHRDVHRMMERLQQDVIAIRRRAGPVPVVLLADGAPELWRLFEQHLYDQLNIRNIELN